MKYHNFFEKKEIEYRSKINQNFRSKKIQNITNKEKNENIIKMNDVNDRNEENKDNNIEKSQQPNIIKIIL